MVSSRNQYFLTKVESEPMNMYPAKLSTVGAKTELPSTSKKVMPKNASSPIDVTDEDMDKYESAAQPSKARAPIDFTPKLIMTVFKFSLQSCHGVNS